MTDCRGNSPRLKAWCCRAWFVFAAITGGWPQSSQSAGLPPWLSADLERLGIPSDSVAVYVKEASTGAVLVNHNGATSFKPASIIKVVTTYSALEALGENYVWHTPVYM